MSARASLLFALATLTLQAETRIWRNADDSSSFRGTYLAHDPHEVSIRRDDGRIFSIEIDRLHPDDRSWLARQDRPQAADPETSAAIFDTLCFGDTRKEVEAKLKASKFVEAGIDETFFGRLGLNGVFRTRQQIGGLHCELYFDWTAEGTLDEISVQTQSLGPDSYDSLARKTWEELIKILSQLHGKALQTGPYPKREELKNDLFLASHLWRLEGGGSALLGTSMQADRYQVVVRFTTEQLEPVRVP